MTKLPLTKSLPLLFVAGALVAAEPSAISGKYQESAQKLITAALADDEGLQRLQYLCDRLGNRISGSESLGRAIQWAAGEMKKAGLENVRTPPVKVPKWVRGKESAVMLAPVQKPHTFWGVQVQPQSIADAHRAW